MKISELRALWAAEKDHYLRSEIGSGVQAFVWEVLQCKQLFGLRRALKSTKDQDRTNEFLLEQRAGKGRADAVIFINAEIVIPVEVERLENAVSGEWQILQYRSAFDQKYGILTDGSEWRFYYGEITEARYFRYELQEILDDPTRFRAFWEEYTRPANYYVSFFFPDVGGRHLARPRAKNVDEYREAFFLDITKVISGLTLKMLNAGYFRDVDAGARERKATETAYSYMIQFVLYKTLVDNKFQDFEEDYRRRRESIRKNLKRGSFTAALMVLEGASDLISKEIYKPFKQEQASVVREVTRLAREGNDNIVSVAPFLEIFVFISKYDFSNVQNEVFGAVYENYLKDLFDQKLGQFFTDGAVVDFMLEEVGYTAQNLVSRGRDEISIVDPSCGSGTFLYSAVRELIRSKDPKSLEDARAAEFDVLQNIYGLDIAEFPLYLAEMSILMRLLPTIISEKYNNPFDKKLRLFYTTDSIAEFLESTGKRVAQKVGRDEGQLSLPYAGFMRDEPDLTDMKRSLNTQGSGKGLKPRQRFDFVVGNPPYISYNESSSMGIEIMRRIKDRSVSLSDIYGWNLHSAPGRRKKYPPKPNLYAFFLALGFALLKPRGRLCFIVPRTLITESDYDVVRHHLAHGYTIEKLISFGGHLFVGRGTKQRKQIATSSLIVVCVNEEAKARHAVECIHYSEEGREIRDVLADIRLNRARFRRMVPQRELKNHVDNWSFITWSNPVRSLYRTYRENSEPMDVYSEHMISVERFRSAFYFDVGFIIDKSLIDSKPGRDKYAILDFGGFVNYANFRPSQFYPRDPAGIKIPKASQGLAGLHSHKLVWQKSRAFKFFYTDADVIPSMSYAQYIASENREEILFLFAILNSRIIRGIYRAMFELVAEQHGLFVVVKRLKEFVRPPLIDTAEKAEMKIRIIELVDRAIRLESRTLSDIVSFDTLLQKFDAVEVVESTLVLSAGQARVRLEISTSDVAVVREVISAIPAKTKISMAMLRVMPLFSERKQRVVLDDVDRLVMKLYGLSAEQQTWLLSDPTYSNDY